MHITPPDTPQLNGVAERINRTLMNAVRTMLYVQKMPHEFWGEAVMHASYVRNRLQHKATAGQIPEELFTGRKASIKNIRTWGCKVQMHVRRSLRNKLEPHALPTYILGLKRGA